MAYFKRKSDFFATEKKRPPIVYTNQGSAYAPVYEYQYVQGIKQLVQTGEENIDDYIQSFKDTQDIHTLISKFLTGDIDNRPGTYGDFRNVPTTYAEMFDRLNACKNSFEQLPVDIRNGFDNSYEKFWSEYGSESFNNVFNEYFAKQAPVSPDPVTDGGVDDAK